MRNFFCSAGRGRGPIAWVTTVYQRRCSQNNWSWPEGCEVGNVALLKSLATFTISKLWIVTYGKNFFPLSFPKFSRIQINRYIRHHGTYLALQIAGDFTCPYNSETFSLRCGITPVGSWKPFESVNSNPFTISSWRYTTTTPFAYQRASGWISTGFWMSSLKLVL